MLVLLGIAFLAGVITAVSPCVLPVLPIVLAGGASGGRRRPYAIISGLLTTFVVSILFTSYILGKLGLPQDVLRKVSIGLLFVVAATLLVPQIGLLVERALAPLGRRRGTGDLGGGFLLGCALGFVFLPCGGPILGYVSAQSSRRRRSRSSSMPTRSSRSPCRTGRTSCRSTRRRPHTRAASSTSARRRSRCRHPSPNCPTTDRRRPQRAAAAGSTRRR